MRRGDKPLSRRPRYVAVVDVAGQDSQEMRTAMIAAHQMLVVVRPSQLDLDTLPHMSELIETALDLNPELRVRGVITQAPTNPNGTERTDAGEYPTDSAPAHHQAAMLLAALHT